ncbi:MAG: SDR family NAD(P)-dependent oxidoreductase [Burkholderiales bacterium]
MIEPSHYQATPGLLAHRVILVTGASRGIGRVAAMTFAAFGATVVLHGRDVAGLESLYDEILARGGPQPAAMPMDLAVATTRDFDSMAGAIESSLGRLDGILHNAATLEKLSALELQTAEEWQHMLRVNLVAPFAITQACSRLLRAAPDASVVLTLESHGQDPAAYWGGYSVSKAALTTLLKIQTQEWAGQPQLRINAIIPGPVASPSRARTHPGEVAALQRQPESLMPAYLLLMGPDSREIRGTVISA